MSLVEKILEAALTYTYYAICILAIATFWVGMACAVIALIHVLLVG